MIPIIVHAKLGERKPKRGLGFRCLLLFFVQQKKSIGLTPYQVSDIAITVRILSQNMFIYKTRVK